MEQYRSSVSGLTPPRIVSPTAWHSESAAFRIALVKIYCEGVRQLATVQPASSRNRSDRTFVILIGPGSSLTIVVGGAAESLSARPGTADLVLRRRLGFIKLAIREGADLVPVFSFGENDVCLFPQAR